MDQDSLRWIILLIATCLLLPAVVGVVAAVAGCVAVCCVWLADCCRPRVRASAILPELRRCAVSSLMRLPATALRSCPHILEHCRWARTRTTSALQRHSLVQKVVDHPLHVLWSSDQDGPARGAVVNRGLPQSLTRGQALEERLRYPLKLDHLHMQNVGWVHTQLRRFPVGMRSVQHCAVVCLLACCLTNVCFFSDQSSCGHLGIILGPGAVLGCTHIHLCGHTHTHVYVYGIGTRACLRHKCKHMYVCGHIDVCVCSPRQPRAPR